MINNERSLIQQPLFTPYTIVTLVVTSVATAAFATLAGFHILYPISAYAAFGLGGVTVLIIALRYITQTSCSSHSEELPLPPLPRTEVRAPSDPEEWSNYLNQLPPQTANLIDGTPNVSAATPSGLNRRP